MEQTRRLRDFMSVGAKAFAAPTGRSAALAAAAAAGMAFVSVSHAAVPIPTQRPAQMPAAGPATPLYASLLPARTAAASTSGAAASAVDVREAFVLRLRQAASALASMPEPAVPEAAVPGTAGTLEERGAAAGLNKVSLRLMASLHPDMQELLVRSRAASDIPFEVVPTYGGKRTAGMQALLKRKGVTKTLMSKHVLGLAFDIAPKTPNGRLDFADEKRLAQLSETVAAQAEALDLPVTWGGSWKFVDMFHFELPADWEERRDVAREPLVAENRGREP